MVSPSESLLASEKVCCTHFHNVGRYALKSLPIAKVSLVHSILIISENLGTKI